MVAPFKWSGFYVWRQRGIWLGHQASWVYSDFPSPSLRPLLATTSGTEEAGWCYWQGPSVDNWRANQTWGSWASGRISGVLAKKAAAALAILASVMPALNELGADLEAVNGAAVIRLRSLVWYGAWPVAVYSINPDLLLYGTGDVALQQNKHFRIFRRYLRPAVALLFVRGHSAKPRPKSDGPAGAAEIEGAVSQIRETGLGKLNTFTSTSELSAGTVLVLDPLTYELEHARYRQHLCAAA